ncbi:pseudouridine synthase [Alloalcanivorax gelatiniphagus]|uniref:Pseudouridine synthase n=1 Tax=Alloalcanivorax gelatiniphagus TaxID=1194167 RepID=A0ABY2XHU4_9GAMM|nr:pseudouridine synthase [Alloalcanivorax gelatiniphagus]TMW11326.1 pseudouridine synthase [Alloalcanivorax gelatiniphagus]|tara:strand:+ start:5776 stop:6507 length:732 start_codon:yes stop_codon:yes gene_type:complete
MRLDRFLARETDLGRRGVRLALAAGRVRVDGQPVGDGLYPVDGFSAVTLDGVSLRRGVPRYLMVHKPAGCVSATRDRHHPTVLDLIDEPEPVKAGLHLAGRLDFNSTGLVLLTNDGRWSRRLTEPGSGEKIYHVRTEDPIGEHYGEVFRRGLYFRYEDLTTLPAELEILGPREARVTLREGRYHHIKRLFGHFDNRVVALHRESVAGIRLDPALAPGGYRPLSDEELRTSRRTGGADVRRPAG